MAKPAGVMTQQQIPSACTAGLASGAKQVVVEALLANGSPRRIEERTMDERQAREIGRDFCAAILTAEEPTNMPNDDFLDRRLRACGCAGADLEGWCDRIKAMPLHPVADGQC